MEKAEFEKLTKGSKICFGKMQTFWGVVIAKAVFDGNGKGEREQVYVDFAPNAMTHGTDPAPFWYDAIGLSVIEYAEGESSTTEIPEMVKSLIPNIDLCIASLAQKISLINKDIIDIQKQMGQIREGLDI